MLFTQKANWPVRQLNEGKAPHVEALVEQLVRVGKWVSEFWFRLIR